MKLLPEKGMTVFIRQYKLHIVHEGPCNYQCQAKPNQTKPSHHQKDVGHHILTHWGEGLLNISSRLTLFIESLCAMPLGTLHIIDKQVGPLSSWRWPAEAEEATQLHQ